MDRMKELGTEQLSKLIFRLSIPAIFGMVVNLLYNIVDRIYVGRLGSQALGAITAVQPYMTILMAFSLLIGSGSGALMSLKLGQNKKEMAEKVLSTSFFLLLAVSLLIMLPSFFMQDFILKLAGTNYTSPQMIAYAKDYLFVIILGSPFQIMGLGLSQNIRSEGRAKAAMYSMVIGAAANIVLDPIFIFALKMGVKGAAIATVIGQALSALYVLLFYFGKFGNIPLKIRSFRPRFTMRIVTLGMPQFLIQIASSAIMLIYNNSLAKYGGIIDPEKGADVALAAFGVISSVSLILLMPLYGLNQGTQPIIGYNYGAKNYQRVKKTLQVSIIYATIWMTFGFLCAQLFPEPFCIYSTPTTRSCWISAAERLRITSLFMPLVGFQVLSSNYFLAVGRPRSSIILSVTRQVVILIPVILFLPLLLPDGLKIYGVVWASPLADILSAIIAGIYIYYEFRRLAALQKIVMERLLFDYAQKTDCFIAIASFGHRLF